MSCEIRSRWSEDEVLFRSDMVSVKLALEAAVKSRAKLTGAKLRNADLTGAKLRNAKLTGADLRGANLTNTNLTNVNLRDAKLTGADLTRADLWNADLTDANLCVADIVGADLTDADLTDANLTDANLTGAYLTNTNLTNTNLTNTNLTNVNLRDAKLTGADLSRANLTPIRDDLWVVLSAAPAEVAGLRAAIVDGMVDGSVYDGECACLIGTIAHLRHCKYDAIPALTPNSARPIERFFLAIRKGDTPETSQFSRLAMEWIDEWVARRQPAV